MFLYAGKPVKTNQSDDIIYEILKVDESVQLAYCIALNNEDRAIKMFKFADLKEL
jgi:hypothetical protein